MLIEARIIMAVLKKRFRRLHLSLTSIKNRIAEA